MLTFLSKLPIFRRLFLGFLLAALIPDIAIILVSSNYSAILQARGISEDVISSLWMFTIGAIIFSTILVVLAGFLINLSIMHPLRHLVLLTRRISRGETDKRVIVSGRDEISIVAASMNSMLDNIVRLIQETQGQRDFLQNQVESLIREVEGIGDGDLRVKAGGVSGALGVLAESFNYIIAELNSLIVRVKILAQEVELSTTNTHERMTELVENAGEQLQHIAIATSEVRQMANFSEQVVERAQFLNKTAQAASSAAYTGRVIIQQTVEDMARVNENVQITASKVQHLGERSSEINDILNVITGIAHQTNRLALDAAVQAAVAGENGKGFRIVADDIRRLAERTKEQTSIIARIIHGFREDISTVAVSMHDTERKTIERVNQVKDTGSNLQKIFGLIEQQAGDITTITTMAQSLLLSLANMTRIMQQVSTSTEQSSISTRIVAQNMEHLAQLAAQLLASVEMFKLNEQAAKARV